MKKVAPENPPDPQGFHPELRQIEEEIVEFFAQKTPEYTGRHPIITKVMAYFYTRKNLTQQDLQTLTGFSAGTISKALHQLVEMNFITKEMIPGTHKHIYKMEQLPFRSPRFFLKTENYLAGLKKELEEMKETLDTQAKDMRHLEGYQGTYAAITQLLALLSRVPVFIVLIEAELEKYLKREATDH